MYVSFNKFYNDFISPPNECDDIDKGLNIL